MLEHPFFAELYDPQNDTNIVEGNPISYYDFEFEQYTLNNEILRELILDEIILANSKEARTYNRELRKVHENGILEKIYERQAQEAKAAAAATEKAEEPVSPSKTATKESSGSDEEMKSTEKVKQGPAEPLNISTASNSPVKMEAHEIDEEGASPVRRVPEERFSAKNFSGFQMAACDEKDEIKPDAEMKDD